MNWLSHVHAFNRIKNYKKISTTLLLFFLILPSSMPKLAQASDTAQPFFQKNVLFMKPVNDQPTLEDVQLRTFKKVNTPIKMIDITETSTFLGYGNATGVTENSDTVTNDMSIDVQSTFTNAEDTINVTNNTNNSQALKKPSQPTILYKNNNIKNNELHTEALPDNQNNTINDDTINGKNNGNHREITALTTNFSSKIQDENSNDNTKSDNVSNLHTMVTTDTVNATTHLNRDAPNPTQQLVPLTKQQISAKLLNNARQSSQEMVDTTTTSSIPAFNTLISKGVKHLHNNQLIDAENAFTQAQRMLPKSSQIYLHLSQTALKKHQPIDAEEFSRRGLTLTKDKKQKKQFWQLILKSARIQNNKNTIAEAQKALQ